MRRRRFLTETNERAAELQIINSVQEGLVAKLDMQSMYDLVGDKIQEIFDAQVVTIGIYDFDAEVTHYPYMIELGERDYDLDTTPFSDNTRRVLAIYQETGKALVIDNVEEFSRDTGITFTVTGRTPKSVVFAPLTTGGKVFGRISLQNVDKYGAFSKADVRLLTTLTSSLAVALENARLFDETQRLLTETNERAAELQIINSVQEGLVAKLDMQSMYDLVGDKIQRHLRRPGRGHRDLRLRGRSYAVPVRHREGRAHPRRTGSHRRKHPALHSPRRSCG